MKMTPTHRDWFSAFFLGMLVLTLTACGRSTSSEDGNTASDPNALHILAGSELKDITDLLPEIESNTGVKLSLDYSGTLDAVEKVASGAEYDAVWVSHGKYLQMTPGARERIKFSEKTMLSPVVLGLKESRAKALGWCGNSNLTWKDIAAAAKEGKFTFGMTNPTSSNSGFTALVGITAALSGKSDALTVADVEANKTLSFFKAQRLTAGSSGWLSDAYLKDQSRVDGLINYESVLLSLNQQPQLSEKLCLIYPKEGIVTADYPLMLLNETRKADYQKVLDFLRTPAFQQRLMDKTLRRPANPAVKVSKAFPSALLIELPFPGQLDVVDALLSGFQNSVRIPAHSWFVLDTSGSMNGEGIEQLKTALVGLAGSDSSVSGRFTRFLNREKIEMVSFSDTVAPVVHFDMGNGAEANAKTLQAINDYGQALYPSGGTAIYDAVSTAYKAALEARKKDGANYYQTIVLMTDGQNGSGQSIDDFAAWIAALPPADRGIRVFPVVFGSADMDELNRLADLTGGRVFDGRKGNLSQIFKEIRGYQ